MSKNCLTALSSDSSFLLNFPLKHTHALNIISRDYTVEKEIGHGTFGVVYRAIHRQSGKAYAIKRSRKPAASTSDVEGWMEVRASLLYMGSHTSPLDSLGSYPCTLSLLFDPYHS